MKTSVVVSGVALCAALVGPLSARANLIPLNGGLELASQYLTNPSLTANGFVTGSATTNSDILPGWTITSGSVDAVSSVDWQTAQGSYCVDMIGSPGVGSTCLGAISQTVPGLTIGQKYQLSFDFAIDPVTITGEGVDTKILDVSVSNSDQSSPAVFSAITGTRTVSNMQYSLETVDFTAAATSCAITFAAALPTNLPATLTNNTVPSATNLYCGPVIDNVDLEPIGGDPQSPEPASLGILGVGGLLLLRRKAGRAR